MRETELTVQVLDTVQNVEKQINELGFEVLEKYDMVDWYFSKYPIDVLAPMQYLDIINNSVIVRNINDDHPRTYLVYKKKELDSEGNVIAEEKYNVVLNNPDEARKILTLAGLTNWCEVVNFSTVYKKGDLSFVLQDIEGLGLFIEYEERDRFPNMSDEEKFQTMKDELLSLGLNLGEDFSCKKVYMRFMKTLSNASTED